MFNLQGQFESLMLFLAAKEHRIKVAKKQKHSPAYIQRVLWVYLQKEGSHQIPKICQHKSTWSYCIFDIPQILLDLEKEKSAS